jgi:hypothetical protein
LYVWEPVSPSDDFVALGMICSNSVDPPPLTEVRCVSARFLAASSMRPKKIWADSASSGGKAGSLWRVSGIGSLGASDTHLAPAGPWCGLRANKAFPADQYPAISPAVKRLLQQRIDELEDVGAADAAIAERAEERRVAAGLTGTREEKSRWLTTSSAWLDNSELHTDSMIASVGSEGPATNVLVDDEETCWQPVSAAEPHWLAFDLQREYNIAKFIVRARRLLGASPRQSCSLRGAACCGDGSRAVCLSLTRPQPPPSPSRSRSRSSQRRGCSTRAAQARGGTRGAEALPAPRVQEVDPRAVDVC